MLGASPQNKLIHLAKMVHNLHEQQSVQQCAKWPPSTIYGAHLVKMLVNAIYNSVI